MEDIKRVFMYHGQSINRLTAWKMAKELTVENVRMQTTVHKRCGTSFLLIVMFVSILFFMFIVVGNVAPYGAAYFIDSGYCRLVL